MTTLSSLIGGLIVTGALLQAQAAWADASPADVAAAEVVFADAKKLVKEGRFNDACPKFEEAERLDPTPGTLLNLGDCYRDSSPARTASAWGAYQQAGVLAGKRDDTARQQAAADRARAIEPVLSKVIISPAPAARVAGLTVTWDGKLSGEGSWGTAIPVDPGDHTLEASAPGKARWTGKVTVRAGAGTMTAEVPALAALAAEAAPQPADVQLAPRWSPQRTVGIAVGAAGLVGIVIGSVYGAKAIRKDAGSHAHCAPGDFTQCDPAGAELGREAFAAATASTVGFLLGGAAIVGGVVTFVTAPSGAPKSSSGARRVEVRPVVGAQTGGVVVLGMW
ncbi:MAG: hypothetical protein ABJE95_06325 [Byssovorax sp.]